LAGEVFFHNKFRFSDCVGVLDRQPTTGSTRSR
jgi:hypothetical protein